LRPELLLKLLASSLRTRRRRGLLTVLTVAWGTLSMVLLLALAEGARQRAEEEFHSFGEPFAVARGGRTSRPWQGWPRGRRVRIWSADLPPVIAKLGADVTYCAMAGKGGILLDRGGITAVANVRGVMPSFGVLRNHTPMPGGRFLSDRDEADRRRVIFLGDEIAPELFGDEDPVGQTVLLQGLSYTVVGVLQHKMAMGFGGESPDTRSVVIPLSTFLVQFGETPVGFLFKTASPAQMPETVRGIREALAARYQFDPEDEQALWVWDRADNAREMRNMFRGILFFMGAIGGLTLFLGGVSVANIMFAAVRQRTVEIGILMALGAKRREVTTPIVVEGLLYTLSGGFVGLAGGWGAVGLLGQVPLENYPSLSMLGHPVLSWPLAAATVTILGCVGTLAGYFPARRAASIDPAETLRYE